MELHRSKLFLFSAVTILVILVFENNIFMNEKEALRNDQRQQSQCLGVPSSSKNVVPKGDGGDVIGETPFNKSATLLEEITQHGRLSTPTSPTTTIDVVVPFDGDLSPRQLGLLLKQVKGTRDTIGLAPQWNEQLRLTLRSLQKHLLCVPRSTSQLVVRTIHIVVRSGASLPSWLRFERADDMPSSENCKEGNLDSVELRIVSGQRGAAFNDFAEEAHISAIPSLSAHFLYFPTGTVFTRSVSRKHLFESVEGAYGVPFLFPRATLPSEMQTATVGEKNIKNGILDTVVATHNSRVGSLHSDTSVTFSGPAVLHTVHVVNTYLFTHYASGHATVKNTTVSSELHQLSAGVKGATAQNKQHKAAIASRSISPLLLHDAALIRSFAVGSSETARTLRHHTVRCWSSRDAVELLAKEYKSMESSKESPLTLRLMPALRHPFWIEQFLWDREAKALSDETKEIAEIMGIASSPADDDFFAYEKRGIEVIDANKLRHPDRTRTYPEPQDPISRFPCGPLRARLQSTSLVSPGVVNDLLRPEPTSSPRHLPRWDAAQANASASAATIASMQCWYPGRPLHAHADELPEVTAVPKLSERVNHDLLNVLSLGAHANETSEQHTIKHHRLATIDMVYTYVKGDAPKWLKKLRETEEKMGMEKDDGRIRDWDELRYSLRSVKKFMCRDGDCCGQESGLGIGAIYIVMATEEHIPEWLTGHKVGTDGLEEERQAMSDEDKRNCRPPLRIITHEMIFPGAGNNPRIGEHKKNPELQAKFLPTYNSHAIESCLHRIPGLRPHYVYLNNDFMFGRNVFVNDFFRPILHYEQPMLEPLIAVEHIVDDITGMHVDILQKNVTREELEMEAALFKSDPQRYEGCGNWPIRRGVKGSLEAEMYRGVNLWTLTKYYNLMLAFDRLEGMDLVCKHAHVNMLFHRDTVHKMLEVDFADIAFQTRAGIFRESDHMATEVMYIYYAFSHRRARGSLIDPAFCANVGSVKYPHREVQKLYQRWNHAEPYEIDRKWAYLWFYQVDENNIADTIASVKSGERPVTTFVSINDNFGRESDEKFEQHFKQFSELMNLLVSNAPPSWFEGGTT